MTNKSNFWQDYGERILKCLDIVSILFIILVLVSFISTLFEHLERPNLIWSIITVITIIAICRLYWWGKKLVSGSEEQQKKLQDALYALKAFSIRIKLLIELQEKPQRNSEDIIAIETLSSLLEPHEAFNTLVEIEISIEKAIGI